MKSLGILLGLVLLAPMLSPRAQAKDEMTTLRVVIQNE